MAVSFPKLFAKQFLALVIVAQVLIIAYFHLFNFVYLHNKHIFIQKTFLIDDFVIRYIGKMLGIVNYLRIITFNPLENIQY